MKRAFLLALAIVGILSVMQGQRTMSAEDYLAAKSFEINNLEKDSYVFFGDDYLLDRYEMKPAFVFKYSDGIERRLYLYLFLAGGGSDTLGFVLFYHKPVEGATVVVPIPGAGAERKAWDLYLDDLKLGGEKEPALLSTLAFVLSREFALSMKGGEATAAEEEDEFEYCFPGDAMVSMADGSPRNMSQLEPGDVILGWDELNGEQMEVEVQGIAIHQRKGIAISEVWYQAAGGEAMAGLDSGFPLRVFRATGNHPVWTAKGKRSVAELETGTRLMGIGDPRHTEFIEVLFNFTSQSVSEVFNLETGGRPYFVDGLLVYPK